MKAPSAFLSIDERVASRTLVEGEPFEAGQKNGTRHGNFMGR